MNKAGQIALVLVVAAVAGTAGVLTRQQLSPKQTNGTTLDDRARSDGGNRLLKLNLTDLDGHNQPLSQWKGKIVVANFWAPWCPPCRKEIPGFAAASQRLADKGVQFVGLSIDSPQNVAAFQQSMHVPYPLLLGNMDTLKLAASIGNPGEALPFTVIIDRQGKIRHTHLGALSESDLEGKIRSMLE